MIGETLHFHVMIWTDKTYHTSEIIRMDQTLKGGVANIVPILASLNPNCERFSFRVF